jgi:HD-GYP domain-containing protein (c-di-GMP phosphodiesterase class II)
MSEPDARAELRRCAGTQFDPEVVAVLLRVLSKRADARGTSEPLAAEPVA